MTEVLAPPPSETKAEPAIPGTPEANDLVVRGTDGDPLPLGTRMIELESYERIIEGLKIAADAAAHLAGREADKREKWRTIARNLDTARRIAVQKAGLGLTLKEKPTEAKHGGDLLTWRNARERFREGCKQAAGGMRQMAVCHRAEIAWSRMAWDLEELARKTLAIILPRPPRYSPLILPEGFRR